MRHSSQQDSNLLSRLVSRRDAFRVFAGLGLLGLSVPSVAYADLESTEAELKEAQAKYDEAQARLEELADEYEELSRIHGETLAKIEDVRTQIAKVEAEIADLEDKITKKQEEIDAAQAEIERKQGILAQRVASAYKTGNTGLLEILLSSSSFDEFVSSVYYLDKISESDAEMIDDIKEAKLLLEQAKSELEQDKAELESKRAELKDRESELEALEAEQKADLDSMAAKQAEVEDLLASLDEDVTRLMEQRDAEILAAAQERARQQAAAAAASGGSSTPVATISSGSGSLARVVSCCYSVPSPGSGLCAMWVSQVFSAAGFGYYSGNACDMYNAWCYSSDRGSLQPGMIVAVSSHASTVLGRIYGHIGIYIGGGIVMDNVGWIRSSTIDQWIAEYSNTVPVRWGWIGGVVLS